MTYHYNRPFKRRCGWCAQVLGWWQLNLCRKCRHAVRWDAPSPPVPQLSQANTAPDRPWWYPRGNTP